MLLQNTLFECGELIQLIDRHGEIKLLHACFVFNNDFVIDIFGQQDIFDDESTARLA